jgi:hypothetical protein
MNIREEFRNARFDGRHLGLGDIRVTLSDQEDICDEIETLKEENTVLKTLLLESSGPMSYGKWSTDFREGVEMVLNSDYEGNTMELDKKMCVLSSQMFMVAKELQEFGEETDNEEAVEHATQLRGASFMLREWCDVVRDLINPDKESLSSLFEE